MLKRVQHDGWGESRAGPIIKLAFFSLIVPATAGAQDLPPVAFPSLPAEAATEEGFVPKGWRIEARAGGDLDGDGRPDTALVLRGADPVNFIPQPMCEERLDTNPRILAMLLARPGGGYRLAVDNHALIPRRDNACQVDPFSDPGQLAIERGILRIDLERMMSAGGWDAGMTTYKLRWRDEALRLIGFDYSNVKRNTGALSRLSVNYLTGRAKIATGNIETDREKIRWTKLRNPQGPTLDWIGDGLAFDPEGLIGTLP
ncbi:MAG TPA: hypothetical protein VE053_00550 [Allosphingosinicella sp.]|nr:hypothetical protein [Allosphingosinicella sp.]